MNNNEINEYIEKNIDNLSVEDAWNDYVRASYLNDNNPIKASKLSNFDRKLLEKILIKFKNKDEITVPISNSPIFVKTENMHLKNDINHLILQRNYNVGLFKRVHGNTFNDIVIFIIKYFIYFIIIAAGLHFGGVINYNDYLGDTSVATKEIKTKEIKKSNETKNTKKEKTHAKVKRYSLTIKSSQKNTKIKILNIKSKYYDKIQLKPGSYKIEMSKVGYKSKIFTVKIKDKNLVISKKLQKITEMISSERMTFESAQKYCKKYNLVLPAKYLLKSYFFNDKGLKFKDSYYWSGTKINGSKYLTMHSKSNISMAQRQNTKAYVLCVEDL